MGVLNGLETSRLGLKGTTPKVYEGERTIPYISIDTPLFEPARNFSTPISSPDTTPAIEMLTEAGELMLTEDNLNITLE